MAMALIFLGMVLAGSDGVYFPWLNFFGGFIMYVGAARMIRSKEKNYV